MDDVQEAVESAKKAQARAIKKLEAEIEPLMEALPIRLKTFRSIDLAHELETLAGLLRARHYLRLSIGE